MPAKRRSSDRVSTLREGSPDRVFQEKKVSIIEMRQFLASLTKDGYEEIPVLDLLMAIKTMIKK